MAILEEEKITAVTKYVVMRDDRKVSDEQFSLEEATKELERWKGILKRWPDGTTVRIEPIN